MDDKQLTSQESIKIIEKMLTDSRNKLSNSGETPLLVFGYLTFGASLLTFYLMQTSIHQYAMLCWFLIPVVGFPLMYLLKRRKHDQQHVKTQLDRVSDIIWGVISINVLLISFYYGQFIGILILWFILLLISIATAITAFIYKIPILKVSSLFGLTAAHTMHMIPLDDEYLVFTFGIIFFIMQCLPGHYLRYQRLKNSRRATIA